MMALRTSTDYTTLGYSHCSLALVTSWGVDTDGRRGTVGVNKCIVLALITI